MGGRWLTYCISSYLGDLVACFQLCFGREQADPSATHPPILLTVSAAILVTLCRASSSAFVGASKSQKSSSSLWRRRSGGRVRGSTLGGGFCCFIRVCV